MKATDFNKLAAKARNAARDAVSEYKAKHGGHDGGTCNFDKVALPGGKRMLKKVEESGLSGYLRSSGFWKGYVLVCAPDSGYQGNLNTVQIEAMAKSFQEGGLTKATVYYQMD